MANLTKQAFALRGEMIESYGEEMISLLEDDDCRGLVNAMCQSMADAGCTAGDLSPASDSKTKTERLIY